jgi:glucose-6-phosphate 1-dehydrogenase
MDAIQPGPTVFVLFGATGDLAKRMVLPAFYQLDAAGLLPVEWRLVGNGRGDVSHLYFRRYVHDVLAEFGPKPDPERWTAFADNLYFAGGGSATDDPGSMLDVVADVRNGIGHDTQLVHYPAVPPSAFQPLTEALAQHDLTDNARIVYEKPFGTSPEGFRGLDEAVHRVVDESQVYRIDHFLGKEATQDLHVLRFANKLFEASWSREHVKAVQIDVPETLDIADRAGFYDATRRTRRCRPIGRRRARPEQGCAARQRLRPAGPGPRPVLAAHRPLPCRRPPAHRAASASHARTRPQPRSAPAPLPPRRASAAAAHRDVPGRQVRHRAARR